MGPQYLELTFLCGPFIHTRHMILWYFYLFSMVLLFDPTKMASGTLNTCGTLIARPAVLLLPAVLLFDTSE